MYCVYLHKKQVRGLLLGEYRNACCGDVEINQNIYCFDKTLCLLNLNVI